MSGTIEVMPELKQKPKITKKLEEIIYNAGSAIGRAIEKGVSPEALIEFILQEYPYYRENELNYEDIEDYI